MPLIPQVLHPKRARFRLKMSCDGFGHFVLPLRVPRVLGRVTGTQKPVPPHDLHPNPHPIPAAPHPPGQVLHKVQGRSQGRTARQDQRNAGKKGFGGKALLSVVERDTERPGKGQAQGRDRFWRIAKKDHFLAFREGARTGQGPWGDSHPTPPSQIKQQST